jgi:hypothetical protein
MMKKDKIKAFIFVLMGGKYFYNTLQTPTPHYKLELILPQQPLVCPSLEHSLETVNPSGQRSRGTNQPIPAPFEQNTAQRPDLAKLNKTLFSHSLRA